jgi:hypothetical protein
VVRDSSCSPECLSLKLHIYRGLGVEVVDASEDLTTAEFRLRKSTAVMVGSTTSLNNVLQGQRQRTT